MKRYREHMPIPSGVAIQCLLGLNKRDQALLCRKLPKWSQMLVTGTSISVPQAKEVIRRTDNLFQQGHSGNNKHYEKKILSLLGADCISEALWFKTSYSEKNRWKAKWGQIYLAEIGNDWISSNYCDGPHGWCHPDGTIFYEDNVGKHPDPTAIYLDWRRIAKCFPYLECEVSLLNGEDDEDTRVVSFVVKSGKVRVYDPEVDVHKGRTLHRRDKEYDHPWGGWHEMLPERGIPWEWVQEWHHIAVEKGLTIPQDTTYIPTEHFAYIGKVSND